MTEKSGGLSKLEQFVDSRLLYDWARSERRPVTLTFLINYTDEEMEDFIRFIVKEWIKFCRRKEIKED